MKQFFEHNSYIIRRLLPMVLFFFAFQLILRVSFIIWEYSDFYVTLSEVGKLFAVGALFDVATLSFFIIPYMLYIMLLPKKFHLGRFDRVATRICYAILLYLLIYDVVAEWVFWDEFHVRYNFIAVDYLVYTNEVLANIWESYPIIWWLSGIGAIAAIIYYYTRHLLFSEKDIRVSGLPTRLFYGIIYMLIPLSLFFSITMSQSEISTNSYANEITKNGIFSLFSAFRNNELDYQKFYLSDYKKEKLPSMHILLEEDEHGQKFISDDPNNITRLISGNGIEKHKNVIVVVMESMSANLMGHFGEPHNLTPNLDNLIKESLFFNNLYATGTRTTRGLEAVTLSIPPSPGRSIVKRQNNENLFSLGFIFQDRGYDTKFIYGGYGYFDNMNYFFENNGFDIVDRNTFADNEQSFANAWGLCDEDLFSKVISEASISYAHKKPFMHMVMTTSNHRPYSFPENKADIPVANGGRSAGARYADFAVGEFLKNAKKQPWFDDTVFIFIADHTAGSAGKIELAVEKYHIPMMIYSPSFIKAREISNLTSQIDLAPILLGLLDFTYYSKFYGENILEDGDEQAHAFIANYQKLGFITNNELIILKPGKKFVAYKHHRKIKESSINKKILLENIAFYKHASGWRKHYGRINTVVKSED